MRVKNRNEVCLTGNLGRPPQKHRSEHGKERVEASLATDRPKPSETTDWHELVAFGRVMEDLLGFEKGAKVEIRGRVRKSFFKDGEGQTQQRTEIIALSVASAAPKTPTANAVIIVGHTTRPATVGYDPRKQIEVASLVVATNRRYKKGKDWVDDEPVFHDVQFAHATAEAYKDLPKGAPVEVHGTLRYRKEPATRKRPEREIAEIIAHQVKLLDESKRPSRPVIHVPDYLKHRDTGAFVSPF